MPSPYAGVRVVSAAPLDLHEWVSFEDPEEARVLPSSEHDEPGSDDA